MKLGIALGSGGARGLAHIGVLEAMAELGYHPERVAGTSMGAVVGAGYCGGHLDELRETALGMDIRRMLFRLVDFGMPRGGILEGKRVNALLEDIMPDATFENLEKPFRCVATDLKTGDEVIFSEGRILPAIRASISIPGVFTPMRFEGRFLVDGGLVNPVPVDQVKSLGADKVVAVDVNHGCLNAVKNTPKKRKSRKDKEDSGSLKEWLRGMEAKWRSGDESQLDKIKDWFSSSNDMPNLMDVMGDTLHIIENQVGRIRLQMDPPDILLQPAVGNMEVFDFHHAEEIIEAGRQSVMDQKEKFSEVLG